MSQFDLEGKHEAKDLFTKSFPDLPPTAAVAAPGRVNLIGEHVDYQGGYVMPLALEHSTYVVGANLKDLSSKCKVVSSKMAGVVEFDLVPGLSEEDALQGRSKWANYVMGMAALYMERGHKIAPFAASISSSVPVGAGLSSSAALEVSVGKLLEELNGLKISPEERAIIAQSCEQKFAGVQCGIMDQLVSSCGRKQHALFIECSEPPTITPVPITSDEAQIVVANSMVPHSLDSGTYNERVRQCKAACAAIGVDKLRFATMEQLEAVKDNLDEKTFARARHGISENTRTEEAKIAFEKGDLKRFGQLMNESHDSLATDYEVSSKGLDALVAIARSVEGVYGSRMTGGGLGGCTVTLVKKDCVEKLRKAILEQYPEAMRGEQLQDAKFKCFATGAGAGARSLAL